MNKVISLIICIYVSALFAQDDNISGTDSNNATGNPIYMTQVILEGSGVGAYTDIEGKFLITDMPMSVHYSTSHQEPSLSASGIGIKQFKERGK